MPEETTRAKALSEWVQALARAGAATEASLEQLFNQKVLGEVLGYELYPGARLHDEVVEAVGMLLDGDARVGGPEDMRIDVALRELWGLSPEDGLHIVRELSELPEGQVIRDLFPDGFPTIVSHCMRSG